MKILLISRCPPYPIHLGDRLIIHHLARQLKQRGHTVDLLAFANRIEDFSEEHHYAKDYGKITLIPEPSRTPLNYLTRQFFPPKRFPRRAKAAWSPNMWWHIEEYIDAEQYDLIHLFGGIQVYEYFHALRDLPAIITPYESYSLYMRRLYENKRRIDSRLIPTFAYWLQVKLVRGFERWLYKPYQRVVVVSPQDKAELLSVNPALKVDVIPNGIDLKYFRAKPKKPNKRQPATLLFVGNYEYAPNVDAAMRLATAIFPAVQEHVPDAKLWLVGNAPPPQLTALASDSIDVTGRVPDVRRYLERATVFVSPLRLGAGIKNKVLEALAMGCPVVATPLSVDGIDVRDGHEALITEDEPATIIRLLNDDNLQRNLSTAGRVLIEERYSWQHVADLYERLYDECATND
jgi:glycosyltransferase involved in cell wall biosynthesis